MSIAPAWKSGQTARKTDEFVIHWMKMLFFSLKNTQIYDLLGCNLLSFYLFFCFLFFCGCFGCVPYRRSHWQNGNRLLCISVVTSTLSDGLSQWRPLFGVSLFFSFMRRIGYIIERCAVFRIQDRPNWWQNTHYNVCANQTHAQRFWDWDRDNCRAQKIFRWRQDSPFIRWRKNISHRTWKIIIPEKWICDKQCAHTIHSFQFLSSHRKPPAERALFDNCQLSRGRWRILFAPFLSWSLVESAAELILNRNFGEQRSR